MPTFRKCFGLMALAVSLTLSSLGFGTQPSHEISASFTNTLNRYGVAWNTPSGLSLEALNAVEELGTPLVLDIGCAFGTWSLQAASKGARVTAIDLDQGHLDTLLSRAKESSIDERIKTVHGNFLEVAPTLTPHVYSIAHMAWVLHFMSGEDATASAKAIYDLLGPGGRVFVSVATLTPGEYPGLDAEVAIRKTLQMPFPGFFEHTDLYADWTHGMTRNVANDTFHFFEEHTLRNVFEAAGFEDIIVEGLSRPSTNAKSTIGEKKDLMLIATKPHKPTSSLDTDTPSVWVIEPLNQ